MEYPKLGPAQAVLMHRALDQKSDFSVVTGLPRETIAARALNGKGWLSRDKARSDLWFSTEKARALFRGWDYQPDPDLAYDLTIPAVSASAEMTGDQLEAASDGAIVAVQGGAHLAIAIKRAQALFDDGDYQSALMLSSGAYDQAKAALGYAKRMQASEMLIGKALRMQADALLIESSAKMALADEYDRAQAAGMVATQGRPKKVSDENLFRLEDVGLSKAKVFEARKLRDAEARNPGIVQRVINERVQGGFEPSRANLRAAVGTASAPKADRGDNFYQTPDVATRTLLALEGFSGSIWEPACGHGAISSIIEDQGYQVILSDLVDRGAVTYDDRPQAIGDFLLSQPDGEGDGPDIVTNPPYGEVLNDFVAHALRVHKPRKMALLLNLNFLCGFADDARNFVLDDNPPARVYVFKRRLPMMHREGYDGPKASSRMNTAWFVWERQEDGGYGDATLTRRVDWMDYQIADALEPGERGHVTSHFNDEDFTRQTPRKTLDERVDEERARAIGWLSSIMHRDDGTFDAIEMRRAIGMRPSTADALLAALQSEGTVEELSAIGASGRYRARVLAGEHAVTTLHKEFFHEA